MSIYVSVYGPYLCVCINTYVCVYTERLSRIELSSLSQDVFGITDYQSFSCKYNGPFPIHNHFI